jgi:hypothetical protein
MKFRGLECDEPAHFFTIEKAEINGDCDKALDETL